MLRHHHVASTGRGRARHLPKLLLLLAAALAIAACDQQKKPEMTPWGTPLEGDSTEQSGKAFDLDDIVSNGEIIMLTMSGPETYYDYHGRGMGLHYLLCDRFANRLGVSLRVEVCKDTAEMVRRLKDGEGDIIAFPLPKGLKGIRYAGVRADSTKTEWAVNEANTALAKRLDQWFKPAMIAQMRREESFLLSTRSIRRHVYSPMLNRSSGVISYYDKYFQQYAPLARWDWRLMAAQCYQESTFDPNARSWAGACGLMQIMPGTADHLGLPREQLFNPERNIAAAAKYIKELSGHFADIPAVERPYFVLAAYNGGSYHVRDAMALARKYGRNPHSWGEVSVFIANLAKPSYYNDPVVKHGYMRGWETADYVSRIRDRWAQYRGVAKGGTGGFTTAPERAKRHYRWHL